MKILSMLKWSFLLTLAVMTLFFLLAACAPNTTYEGRDLPKERVECWSNGVKIVDLEVESAFSDEGTTQWIATRKDREYRYSTADCVVTPIRDGR